MLSILLHLSSKIVDSVVAQKSEYGGQILPGIEKVTNKKMFMVHIPST